MTLAGAASSPFLLGALLIALSVSASGCQSTADRSAELERTAGATVAEKGVIVSKQSRDIDVVDTTALSDDYGTAVVVEMKNKTKDAIANPPISVTIPGADKKPLYTNDEPGLDPALTSVALIDGGKSAFWVNDQIPLLAEKPKKVDVTVGKGDAATGSLPELKIDNTEFFEDSDGASLRGRIANRSKVLQTKLVIYGLARKGGKVIGAGTGQLERLAPGRRANFQLFLIGESEGAKYEFYAPPTVLR